MAVVLNNSKPTTGANTVTKQFVNFSNSEALYIEKLPPITTSRMALPKGLTEP